MAALSKRQRALDDHCSQLRARRQRMAIQREIIRRDATVICRKPSTLVGALMMGGLLGYLFQSSRDKVKPGGKGAQSRNSSKGTVRMAGKLALIRYLSELFQKLPGYLLRKESQFGFESARVEKGAVTDNHPVEATSGW